MKKITAVGLFLVALAINVKVTLDDPFVLLSEQALAQESSDPNGSNGGSTGRSVNGLLPGLGTQSYHSCWAWRLTGGSVGPGGIGVNGEYVPGRNYDCSGWSGYCEWTYGCEVLNP